MVPVIVLIPEGGLEFGMIEFSRAEKKKAGVRDACATGMFFNGPDTYFPRGELFSTLRNNYFPAVMICALEISVQNAH